MKVNKIAHILLAILLLGFNTVAFTQNTMSFSLEQARDYAVKNNYAVKNAQIGVDMAKKKVWETTAIGLPQVTGSATVNDYIKIPTTLIPGDFIGLPPGQFVEIEFGTKYNATYGLTIGQLLFNGSYIVGLQTANIYKKLSDQNLEKSEADVKDMVTGTYYLVLVAEESKRILDSIYKNISRTYFEVQQFYKEGFVELSDVDQMKMNVTNLENKIEPLNKQIEVAYRLLKYQMGVDLDQDITLTDKLYDIIDKINFDALAAQPQDVNRNVDYKLLNTQEQLLFLNLKNEKAKLLPTLSAFYTTNRNAQRQEFDIFKGGQRWFPTTLMGVNLNVPLFGSGQKLARISQAKMQLDQIKNSKMQLEQGLELQATQARSELLSALIKYKNEHDNVITSKNIYDRTYIKYKEGLATSSDLYLQHTQYLTAQTNYIQAISDLLTAKNKLDKTLGNY